MSEKKHLVAPRSHISQEMREERRIHKGMVFWLTGLSGSGKSTLAHAVEEVLFQKGYEIVVLDGDAIRKGLCADLGFSPEDRAENNRRIAELAKIFVRNGTLCLCAFISPSAEARKAVKQIIGPDFFREVYIACSLEECLNRDPKAFYKKAKAGEIQQYTGVAAGYDVPLLADCTICTEGESVDASAKKLLTFIMDQSAKNA
ncbi:adenylyl-sulfate kinase [Desulfovibrio sp. OttesenSCG-928-G15]|nr:adenylyl-sulfate kinase [Desulfovibrio sp. OttesenSCG-928-G15]